MRKEFKITSRTTNRPIAFFDSGVGGLTVYAKLKELLPDENYLYLGDTKNMPYGEKTAEQLLSYADKIIKFFIEKDAKAVVMACNTTSSVIYDKIKDKYNIKIYPIIQSAAKILAELPIKRLGVFATPATVNSQVYVKEINKYNKDIQVFQIACPEWVKLVENQKINTPECEKEIKSKIDEILKFNPEKIVLGCTHYPFLKDTMAKFAPKDLFIDPASYFAQYIKEDLIKNNLTQNAEGLEEIYVSANPEQFVKSAKMFYEIKTLPKVF